MTTRALAAELLRDGGIVVETVGTDGAIWLRTLWQIDGDSVTWCVPQLRDDPYLVEVHFARIGARVAELEAAIEGVANDLQTAAGRAKVVARIVAAAGSMGGGVSLPSGWWLAMAWSAVTAGVGVAGHRWGPGWVRAVVGREVRKWLGGGARNGSGK